MDNLGDALLKEQARCRDLRTLYNEIGSTGDASAATIGSALQRATAFVVVAAIETALRRADEAVMTGDIVAMIQSYQELKDFE